MDDPRTTVYKTLEFDTPARVPRQLWVLPWAKERYPSELAAIRRDFPDDIVTSPGFYRREPPTRGAQYEVGEYIDPWGCVFENMVAGYIGEVKRPLVPAEDTEWNDTSAVRFPEEWLSVDVAEVNRFCRETDRFVLAGGLPRPFEQLQFIRGTEQLFVDLALRPLGLDRFISRMHAFYCEIMELWAGTDVDALFMMDDWGTQGSLLIHPDTWRDVFRPLYRDYIEIAKRKGKKIFMHSDGYTFDIYEPLIELGLDAFNSQVFCMGIDRLAQFRGRITFWGEVDRQHILPYGEPQQVREAVRKVRDTLWQDGGCIAQCEFGVGARPENVRAVFEEWNIG